MYRRDEAGKFHSVTENFSLHSTHAQFTLVLDLVGLINSVVIQFFKGNLLFTASVSWFKTLVRIQGSKPEGNSYKDPNLKIC